MGKTNSLGATTEARQTAVKLAIGKNEGKPVLAKEPKGEGFHSFATIQANILTDLETTVRRADALRKGNKDRRSVEYTLGDIAKDMFGFGSADALYAQLGINPSYHTVEMLHTMSDHNNGFRWLQPEVIREAIRLGLRKNPIYPDLVAAEESVDQKRVTMPYINKSDATPEILNEGETISVGSLSFGEKNVDLKKIGTGLQVSDEVQKYVSLNILSLYLQDAGVQLGLGMDTMALDVLINGDYGTGFDAAPVIGTQSGTDIEYFDLLRIWLRMGRLGRMPAGMLSNEDAAINILQLDEFKGANYNNRKQDINIKTPIPQSQDYLVHGAMPTGKRIAIFDNTSALIKLNSTALLVESERIARRQMNGTYATVTTGFAKIFRDAFVVLDGTIPFAGFPAFMDVDAAENVIID